MKINMNAAQGPSEKLPTSTKVAGIGENDGKNLLERSAMVGNPRFQVTRMVISK